MKEGKEGIAGRRGGIIFPQRKGDPPLEGAGRKPNVFKQAVRSLAENEQSYVVMEGIEVDESGNSTGRKVRVSVLMPTVQEIVYQAARYAAKGSVEWARWLSETGYGKPIMISDDDESPIFSGISFILEDKRSLPENVEPTEQ